MRKKAAKEPTTQQAKRAPGTPLVVLYGRREVLLYDCKKILFYGKDRICLLAAKEVVTLEGRGLYCRSFTAGTVLVEGEIASVLFGAGETTV